MSYSTRSLSGIKLSVQLKATLKCALASGIGTPSVVTPNLDYAPPFKNGVGPNMANRGHQITGTLLAGQSIDIDLFNMAGLNAGAGAGNDALGQPIRYEAIQVIAITNDNDVDVAGHLEITPSASNGWDAIGEHTTANGGALNGQGLLLKSNPAKYGFEVGNSDANDQINLKAVGGNIDYTVYLLASSDLTSSSSSASSSVV